MQNVIDDPFLTKVVLESTDFCQLTLISFMALILLKWLLNASSDYQILQAAANNLKEDRDLISPLLRMFTRSKVSNEKPRVTIGVTLTAIEAMWRPRPTMPLVEIHPLPTSLLMNTELAISTTTSLPTNPTLCPMVTTASRQNLTTTSTMIEMIQGN